MCRVKTVASGTFGGLDGTSIDETPVASESHAVRGLGHVCASAFSILFVIVALLLPLDHASHVASDGVATTNLVSTATHKVHQHHHYTPKRGKFVGETFDAKDLYDAYKEVEIEYHTKAFRSNNWRVLASRQEAEVSLMEHPSDPSCPYVKMVAVIPAPIQDCWNWLSLHNWPTNMPKMDPFYEGVELYGNFEYKGVNMILARKRTKRILAFGKRDMVFLSVSDQPLEDGTWVSGSVSVQTPQLPRQDGYTRAFQDSIAFYKPLDGNTKTRLTIVCRIDLNDSSEDGGGGWIPMWVYVKTIGATGIRSVTSMRDVIVKDKELADAEAARLASLKADEKKDGNLLEFWKRKLDKVVQPTIQNLDSRKRRWHLPWQKPLMPPVTKDDHGAPDVGRHRVPRFFFNR